MPRAPVLVVTQPFSRVIGLGAARQFRFDDVRPSVTQATASTTSYSVYDFQASARPPLNSRGDLLASRYRIRPLDLVRVHVSLIILHLYPRSK